MAAGAVEVAVTSNNSKACANFDGVDDVITATNVFPNFFNSILYYIILDEKKFDSKVEI